MTFAYDDALKKSLLFFNNEELAANVFLSKYAERNLLGELTESEPGMMHDRLAKEFARIDKDKYNLNYEERFSLYREQLDHFSKIVPQGSVMSAVGNRFQTVSASNCVVIPAPEDSMAGIFKTGEQMAQLYKRRAGVGTTLESLRPEGMGVSNAARTTSGAWSFADFYSFITRMVGQSGRRGALMLSMDVHHPDVEKFATSKHDLQKVTGANISIKLTDEFLSAVDSDTEYEQRWPCDPEKAVVRKMVRARDIWDVIVKSSCATAEPGLLFWNNIQKNLPAECYPHFKSISTNPCSEIPLSQDSCRLISLNLTGFVKNAFEQNATFDTAEFSKSIKIAMQMIDNLVDIEIELVSKIIEASEPGTEREIWQNLLDSGERGRRTGLGTHGLADTLAQLNVRYDSKAGLDVVDGIYKTLRNVAYETSIELAETRGPFPEWDWELEKDNEFIQRLPTALKTRMKKCGRRNISILTQAPTGSVSLLSKCGEFDSYNLSSGVEPVFRNMYVRRKKINPSDQNSRVDYTDELGDSWQEFKILHGNVQNYIKKTNGDPDEALPEFFVTSDQINWEKRIEIQAVEQQYIDHAISSTVNLPRGTTSDVVGQIYMDAWKHNLKGITVYVEGSRDGVLIAEGSSEKDDDGRPTKIASSQAPRRPETLPCEIHNVQIKGVRWTILIGMLDGSPYEVFVGHSDDLSLPTSCTKGRLTKRKKGVYDLHVGSGEDELIIKNISRTFSNSESAWATRVISAALRHGTPVEFLAELLAKDGNVTDINKVIGRLLKKSIKDGSTPRGNHKCPSCGSSNLAYEEGCLKCLDCGHAKCG